MAQEDSITLVLDGIAARDDVDQEPAIGNPVERCGHACGDAWRLQARPHRNEIAQPFGKRRDAGGDDPGILARPPGWQQHAEIAELVGSLRDLAQIIEVHFTPTDGRAEIAAVTMGRQEPEDVGLG